MQTIYIDILLSVNLIINYLLLSATSFYTHTKVSVKRIILGSLAGAVCSLAILLPKVPFLVNMLIKTLTGGITVLAAFGRRRTSEFVRLYVVFLITTFFFCGIVIALWFMFTPKNLLIKNSIVYLNISPVMLIVYSLVCYCAFRVFNTIAGKHKTRDTYCMLTVCGNNNAVRVNAKIDTGNTLKEPFSQCPVIVMGRHTAQAVTPAEILEYETVTTLRYRTSINSIRFVPFTSVNGEGIMPGFKAEQVYLNDKICDKNVYIALCKDDYIQGDFKAIIPFEIL